MIVSDFLKLVKNRHAATSSYSMLHTVCKTAVIKLVNLLICMVSSPDDKKNWGDS